MVEATFVYWSKSACFGGRWVTFSRLLRYSARKRSGTILVDWEKQEIDEVSKKGKSKRY